jgi:hypothetical protein
MDMNGGIDIGGFIGFQTAISAIMSSAPLTLAAMGNETEVYRTDDRRFVVKLKHELGRDRVLALREARQMRAAAEEFVACLGPEHSVDTQYVVARDQQGLVQVLVVQPFLRDARPLFAVDWAAMKPDQRSELAAQLRRIIRNSLTFYRRNGYMPDLYGRTSASRSERRRSNTPTMLPRRLWSFLVLRNLLRSHNLMLTDGPTPRIVLVDYDTVRRGKLYRTVYFGVRWFLFWRDRALIARMEHRSATSA